MIKLSVLCACLFLTCALAARLKWHELTPSYTFETYLQHYGKHYSDHREYEMRKGLFQTSLNEVLAHNQDATKTWKEEINHFADWTPAELKGHMGYKKQLGYARKAASAAKRNTQATAPLLPASQLPLAVDWRLRGVVSPVKDQGQCGSCWSFATAETIESHVALNNSGLWELSEQQILDCTVNPQNCGGHGGCAGGTAEVALATIIKQGGLASEWTYPYLSHAGVNFPKCLVPNKTVPFVVTVKDYISLTPNEYLPLLNAIATVGPIAISVDASSWHKYATGVFNGCNQTHPDLDHAVQLVGFGFENGLDFWLVRNSWTPAWGEGGYIKLLRPSGTPQCGVDLTPSDGSGCDGGPTNITVCGTCGILYDNVYPIIG